VTVLRSLPTAAATSQQTHLSSNHCSAPDPAEGAYSAPPDSLAGLRGPTSKGGEGKGWERRGREEGKKVEEGQGNRGNGREGVGMLGKGEGRRGKGGRRGEKGGEGKKSKNIPSINSCLRP